MQIQAFSVQTRKRCQKLGLWGFGPGLKQTGSTATEDNFGYKNEKSYYLYLCNSYCTADYPLMFSHSQIILFSHYVAHSYLIIYFYIFKSAVNTLLYFNTKSSRSPMKHYVFLNVMPPHPIPDLRLGLKMFLLYYLISTMDQAGNWNPNSMCGFLNSLVNEIKIKMPKVQTSSHYGVKSQM